MQKINPLQEKIYDNDNLRRAGPTQILIMTRRKTTKKPQANAAQNKRTAAEKPKPSTPRAGQSTPQKKAGITAKPVKPPKRKNVSQNILPGRTIQTRDEFFEGAKDYLKPGYENKGYYRKGLVVDSNRDDELVIVKLHKPDQSLSIPGSKSTFKPYVEVKDDDGNPIKIGKKFVLNSNTPSKTISKHGVAEVKKVVFGTSRNSNKNRELARQVKGRKKAKKYTGRGPYKPKT